LQQRSNDNKYIHKRAVAKKTIAYALLSSRSRFLAIAPGLCVAGAIAKKRERDESRAYAIVFYKVLFSRNYKKIIK